ncbi:hypothetical protein [Dactylosporangium sp. NPDC005555]|uniref:hypothetical protein n=1 Tax=Dactylosporangium sp. NPDC005555 TaxID=3154889 RepID=UPI0033A95735
MSVTLRNEHPTLTGALICLMTAHSIMVLGGPGVTTFEVLPTSGRRDHQPPSVGESRL